MATQPRFFGPWGPFTHHAPEAAIRRDFGFDSGSVRFIAASAATHILLLLLIMSLPDSARGLELDSAALDDRFVQLALTPEQQLPPEPQDTSGELSTGSTARHVGDEGEAGEADAADTNGRIAIQGPPENEDVELRRERDREIAATAGIAGTLQNQVASPWGLSDRSIGSDAEDALGALDGASPGEARGFGGLGIHGAGQGGGGDREGSIGLDRIGTNGMSNARNRRHGRPDLGDHETDAPEGEVVNHRPPILDGALDREIIQRIVRQHRREIKDCYQVELQKNRALSGEVVVSFTVAGSGRVVAALVKDSSLKNSAVESCMTRRIRRWIFPEPRNGGMVVVKYPFRFSKR